MRAGRKYPPVLAIGLLIFLMLAVLPSALNLPQTNPSTTLEYAPVPPEDSTDPPPGGDLSALGLGSTSGVAEPADPPTPPPAVGSGKNPRTKRCVGKPLRQTEDPLSPPCVAYFEGNNFGATYTGVTADEIRIVLYLDCCNGPWTGTGRGTELDPRDATLFDANAPPRSSDSVWLKIARAYQRFFNERYQTYNRKAHLYVFFSREDATPETRRADAADVWSKVKPFAVVGYVKEGNEDAFLEAMARHGVLNFGAYFGRSDAFYGKYAKRVWGYLPSLERQVEQFASFVCRKVVPHPVSFSGNPGDMGKPRKLGFLWANNSDFPDVRRFAELVRTKIKGCGGTFVVDRPFTTQVGKAIEVGDVEGPQEARANIAQFRSRGVTTIIWPQGYEANHTKAAERLGYRPEWVVAGDGSHDGYQMSTYQEQSVWRHAVTVTNQPLLPDLNDQHCFLAQREAQPSMAAGDANYGCTQGNFYNDLRQLFSGIQAAGPRLTPDSIDEGFRAIPPHTSSDPRLPACYYEPGDYTCVKDAAMMRWDPAPERWHMLDGGRRYTPSTWPKGNVPRATPNDPPNSFRGTGLFCC